MKTEESSYSPALKEQGYLVLDLVDNFLSQRKPTVNGILKKFKLAKLQLALHCLEDTWEP